MMLLNRGFLSWNPDNMEELFSLSLSLLFSHAQHSIPAPEGCNSYDNMDPTARHCACVPVHHAATNPALAAPGRMVSWKPQVQGMDKAPQKPPSKLLSKHEIPPRKGQFRESSYHCLSFFLKKKLGLKSGSWACSVNILLLILTPSPKVPIFNLNFSNGIEGEKSKNQSHTCSKKGGYKTGHEGVVPHELSFPLTTHSVWCPSFISTCIDSLCLVSSYASSRVSRLGQ